jgi:hypothetical protein
MTASAQSLLFIDTSDGTGKTVALENTSLLANAHPVTVAIVALTGAGVMASGVWAVQLVQKSPSLHIRIKH